MGLQKKQGGEEGEGCAAPRGASGVNHTWRPAAYKFKKGRPFRHQYGGQKTAMPLERGKNERKQEVIVIENTIGSEESKKVLTMWKRGPNRKKRVGKKEKRSRNIHYYRNCRPTEIPKTSQT